MPKISKKKKKLLILLALFILGGGVIAGSWWYSEKNLSNQEEKEDVSSEQDHSNNEQAEEESRTDTNKVDKYSNWKTYTNSKIGYTLKYPTGWVLKEFDHVSEITGMNVKYITITTPDGKYFLYFGLKKESDTFGVTDRTGIGAGEIKRMDSITVLGESIIPEALIYQGKTKEMLYYQDSGKGPSCGCQFVGYFSPDYPAKIQYESVDMTSLEYVKTAEDILESVQWI